METIIKLTKADIVTRAFGLNISIDTTRDDFVIILDADAAVEFAKDIRTLIPGGFDGTGDLTPRGDWLLHDDNPVDTTGADSFVKYPSEPRRPKIELTDVAALRDE